MENYTLNYSKRSFRYAIINLLLVSIFILLTIFKPEKASRSVSLFYGIIFCVLSTLSFSGIYFYHRGADHFTLWKKRLSFLVHNCVAILILLWFLSAAAYLTGFIN